VRSSKVGHVTYLRRLVVSFTVSSVVSIVASGLALAGIAVAPASAFDRDAPATIRLVEQTFVTGPNGTARFLVDVSAVPADAEVKAAVYPRLSDDEQSMADALRGRFSGDPLPFRPVLQRPLKSLLIDNSTSKAAIDIPTALTDIDGAVRLRSPGVYPVRITIIDNNEPLPDASLVSFIVRSDGPALTKSLAVAIVVPVGDDVLKQADGRVALSTDESTFLRTAVAAAKRDLTLPFTFAVRPETVASLSTSPDPAQQALAASLAEVARAGEVVADTFVPVDPSGAADGFTAEYAHQLTLGQAAVKSWLDAPWTDAGIRYTPTPVTDAGVEFMRKHGMQKLLVPLSAITESAVTITGPHELRSSDSKVFNAPVAVIDPTLSAAIDASSNAPDTTLAGWQFVARLAHRALAENPRSDSRFSIVALSPSHNPSGPFLDTVTAALSAGPADFIKIRTLSEALRVTPRQQIGKFFVFPTFRTATPIDTARIARVVSLVRLDIDQLSSIAKPATPGSDPDQLLTLASSTALTDAQRDAYLNKAKEPFEPNRTALKAPDRQKITLRRGRATIPITLRSTITDRPVSVRVHLVSSKATFPKNDLVVTLVDGFWRNTIEIDARDGQNDVTIELYPPVGDQRLAFGNIEVNTINIGGLGVLLSGALVALTASWWIASVRKKRRLRQPVSATATD
jgi:hypothetical protein